MAVVNKKTFPSNLLQKKEKVDDPGADKGSMLDICGSRILRREVAILYLAWFTTSLVYYGLSLNAAAFGDVFLNTMLSGLIEIPANLLCILCLEKAGRRIPNAISLMVAGVFCLAIIPVLLVDNSRTDILTALSTLGKGAITFTFSSIYIYSSEMFHTSVRHLALGSASTFARIGSMISPFIGAPLAEIWEPMPTLIFGVISIVTGFVCLMLPETKGKRLPESLEEAEDLGRLGSGKSDKSADISRYERSDSVSGPTDKDTSDICTLTKFNTNSHSPDGYDNLAFGKTHQF